MIKKYKAYLYIYFLLVILCMFIRISSIQNILLIIACMALNLVTYYKLNINNKKFKYVSLFIICINIALIYVKYFNTIKIGFFDGLPLGSIGNGVYNDSYGYYYQSITLADLWMNGGFIAWITSNIPKFYVDRGIYNYFIVYNSIIRVLFGKDLITWMLIKYQSSIISISLMYCLSKNFVKEKYALVAILLFNFYPGYLIVNTDLMRDNIIVLFIILTFYLAIKNKNNAKKAWIGIILLLCIVTYLRVYIGLIMGISLYVYYFFYKFNLKRIVLNSLFFVIAITIIGKVMQLWGYGFLGLNLLQSGAIESTQWNSQAINTPIKLIIRSLYLTFIGGRSSLNNCSAYILEIYNAISPIFVAIIVFPTFYLLLFFKRFSAEQKRFITFSFIFVIFSGIIVTYGFSSIVPRLYICWIWCQCILFAMILNDLSEIKKELRILLKFQYIVYIMYIIIGFTNW